MNKSVLRQAALASNLVSSEDLDFAARELGATDTASMAAISDEALGEKLIELGKINRWQAEQLRAGRSKFNLGPYHVIDSIGAGGMGQVFKAEHNLMGRVVAIKVLPRSRMTDEAIANFTREIRTQAQLDHENLVRAYDAGHDGNVYFLVTEYVPGTDLRRWIRTHGRLQPAAAASVIAQGARGLEHAHRRGLIHRDVKPGNMLITPEGRVKVSDLGLAAFFQEEQLDESLGKKIVGTADYLAPEQIIAPDRLSPASDIYSLGCTLYYCVTGKVPFPGGKARDKARAHCTMAPLDPRRLNPELDDAFVELMAEMMAKDPDERIQTAADVADRLAPWAALAPANFAAAASQSVHVGATRSIAARSVPPAVLQDTAPGSNELSFLADPILQSSTDSISQISLGTEPLSPAIDDIFPDLDDIDLGTPLPPRESFSPRLKMLIMIGGATAGIAIAAMLVSTVLQAILQ